MEHIVQFGISIDDKRIASSIESNAEREITDKLYKEVEEVIFGRYRCLSDFVRDKMDDFFAENCDKIIDIAGELPYKMFCNFR